MNVSEKTICELLSGRLPSGRLNACFESDAEVIALNGGLCLFTTDEFSEEDLFREDDARRLGWNIAAGAISDIYACGGRPLYYAHALTVDERWDAEYVGRFGDGVREVLEATGARFIGGDCSRSRLWRCTPSVLGVCEGRSVLRRGAAAGDGIYLTGPVGAGNLEAALRLAERGAAGQAAGAFGGESTRPGASAGIAGNTGIIGSALGLFAPLRGEAGVAGGPSVSRPAGPGQRLAARKDPASPGGGWALRLPVRRQESMLVKRFASACLDTSDGLWAGLNALADLNGCGYAVADLPYLQAGLEFCGEIGAPTSLLFLGECGEYELLFTVRPEREEGLMAAARELGCALHRLGTMTAGERTLRQEGPAIDLASFQIQARDYRTPEEYLGALLSWLAQTAGPPGTPAGGRS